MAEPQPSSIHEGTSTPPPPPAAASEAAALSSLDNKTLSSDAANTGPKKEVDLKALNDAMKALDAGSGKKAAATAGTAGVKKDEEPAKLIKVDAADVALVAEQLDLSKPKATELLRAHDADAVRAMKAWVAAAV